jgi:hypothetical protein
MIEVNPNQWGVTEDTVGSLCMNVSTGTLLSQCPSPLSD